MAVSLQTLSDADHRRLAQKEKLKAVYELLQDIPDEKVLYLEKKGAADERAFYDNSSNLHWVTLRIKQRITEANVSIQEAIERIADGVLDLSRRNLCDLTIKDFNAPLLGVKKIILSGNFFRTLPPICSFKPFLETIVAVGNLVDLEPLYEDYQRENQVSFDLFQIFKSVCSQEFEGKEEYIELLTEISANVEKASIVELSHRVHALMSTHKPSIMELTINPYSERGRKCGGVRGFIPLNYFSGLRTLNLSGCQLESLAPFDWLSNLAHLKKLDLSHTPITELPASLIGKPVEELNLSHTQITSLPLWIESLESLKILNISDTRVAILPNRINRLALERCYLDGTRIIALPEFRSSLQILSIKRTQVAEISQTMLRFFKNGVIHIDETNRESLKLQARVSRNFHSPVVATWVYAGEKFKMHNEYLPQPVKTSLVGLKYISAISFLFVWQLCDSLMVSAPLLCQARGHMRSSHFARFRAERAALAYSVIYLLLLYQIQPLSRRWNDIKGISKFLTQ